MVTRSEQSACGRDNKGWLQDLYSLLVVELVTRSVQSACGRDNKGWLQDLYSLLVVETTKVGYKICTVCLWQRQQTSLLLLQDLYSLLRIAARLMLLIYSFKCTVLMSKHHNNRDHVRECSSN